MAPEWCALAIGGMGAKHISKVKLRLSLLLESLLQLLVALSRNSHGVHSNAARKQS